VVTVHIRSSSGDVWLGTALTYTGLLVLLDRADAKGADTVRLNGSLRDALGTEVEFQGWLHLSMARALCRLPPDL
jgi:hypothetical protein